MDREAVVDRLKFNAMVRKLVAESESIPQNLKTRIETCLADYSETLSTLQYLLTNHVVGFENRSAILRRELDRDRGHF